MGCNNDCSGHGSCLTMGEAASRQDDHYLLYSTTYTLWDADKIMGCVCDVGYTGYDCSLRKCVVGHDPLTAGSPVDEVQSFDCTGTSGSFKFKFRGHVTGELPQPDRSVQYKDLTKLTRILLGGGQVRFRTVHMY